MLWGKLHYFEKMLKAIPIEIKIELRESAMHENIFLQDLSVVMIVAGIVTILFRLLKQPVVLGYILAGVIIGPHTPPFPLVTDPQTIQTLAEMGVIFLLFSLGLDFNLGKLKKVGGTSFIAALLEIALMILVGYFIGRGFGWDKMDSLFLGAILSISSTTIIVKVLRDLGKTKEKSSDLIFGILIVEDILAILIIALLSGLAMTGTLTLGTVVTDTARLFIFLVGVTVFGFLVVPKALSFVNNKLKSDETLLVTVLGFCFGVALLALKMEYSVALGAFLIGAIVAEARQIGKITSLIEPIKDMFSSVFFVAVGMQINPKLVLEYLGPILIVTAVVVIGKVLTCAIGTLAAGNDRRTSLRVGMGLAQIGEFSFIIASLGLTLGVTSHFIFPIAVSVSALTTLLTPYLIRSSDHLVQWFDRFSPRLLTNYLDFYHAWGQQVAQRSRESSFVKQQLRRMLLQIGLNITLIAGIFTVCILIRRWNAHWLPGIFQILFDSKTFLWLLAMLLSLPLFIATVRKLQALSIFFSEMSVKKAVSEKRKILLRAVVSNTLLFIGILGIGFFVFLLSLAILPPSGNIVWLLLVFAAAAVFLWKISIRIYAKAQITLREVLAPIKLPELSESNAVEKKLHDAKLELLTILKHSPASGKLLGELQLRTLTGASVVGIERPHDQTFINPGPNDELCAGDKVLLMGNPDQIKAARKLISPTMA